MCIQSQHTLGEEFGSYKIIQLGDILGRRLQYGILLGFLLSFRRAGPNSRQARFYRCAGGPGGGEGAVPLTPFA